MQGLDLDRDGQVTREEMKLGMRRLPDLDSVLLEQQQGSGTMSTENPLVGGRSRGTEAEGTYLREGDKAASEQTGG